MSTVYFTDKDGNGKRHHYLTISYILENWKKMLKQVNCLRNVFFKLDSSFKYHEFLALEIC
jgi:hypothetical protein